MCWTLRGHAACILSLLISMIIPAQLWAAIYSGTVLYPLVSPDGYAGGAIDSVGQAAIYGMTVGSTDQEHAALWVGSSVTDLNPAGFNNSDALATNGVQEVGWGASLANDFEFHALLWSGTAASAVDLNPADAEMSQADGLSATQQVGFADLTGPSLVVHAMLWTGSATSAVDLNPTNLPGITSSYAFATDGRHQVGEGNAHAMIWSGTANSAVDLNPRSLPGISYSTALGLSGNQQVGYGAPDENGYSPTGAIHALLWNGSADSAVDLNPDGFARSIAFDTNGAEQVGYALASSTKEITTAFLWSGTAASAINLQFLLPAAGTWTDSYAYAIDFAGNVYGVADGTFNGVTGSFGIEWSPLPEPALMSLLLVPGLFSRRRR